MGPGESAGGHGKAATRAILVLLLGLFAAAAPAPPEVVVRGTVKDQSGAPLGDYPVRLIKTKTTLNLLHFGTGSQLAEAARAQTDGEGRYEIKIVPDPKFDYFYLRFYDPKTFDPVRYRVPADVDVTKRVRQKPEVVVDAVIGDHPDWGTVKGLLAEFGPDSNRGKILRRLGLPERRETVATAAGRENWWYYAQGICYQLQADSVLKIRHFDPVLPPRRSG